MFKNAVVTGGTFYHTTQNYGTLKILTDAASPSAFHNSGSRHDPPKCHENTRVAVLKKLKDWVIGANPETKEKWIMWMYGGAGAGKSAIGQTFAEKCDDEGRLLASFFFGRSDPTRNHVKFLVPTIACQVYQRVPEARNKILSAIDDDPLIFNKALLIQLEELVIQPLLALAETLTWNLIIIDGLDECLETASQTTILRALFDLVQRPNSRICFLVASRPEHDIVTIFSLQDNAIFARLVLDHKYRPHKDIELFLNDKIRIIKETHPFRHLIPPEWPEDEDVDDIVEKSSGQFIYVSTSVKYIESIRHRPEERMAIVRNLRPAQGDMPFAELDALYTHILTSVEEVSIIVELLSFLLYASQINQIVAVAQLEEIHDLKPGSLRVILCDLGSLVVIDEDDRINVLHASLLDFLIDPSRSKDLPISGNVLMTKHITACFHFLSKNKSSDDSYFLIFVTKSAVEFLTSYLDRIPVFTADMAEAFDGFSLLKLYQQDIPLFDNKHHFLKWVNPVILRLLRQSDQHQFLSRYLTMMDESFLAMMDKYPPHTLALQISIMTHDDAFPDSALDLGFQLPAFRKEDDKLRILNFHIDPTDLGPTKAHRSILHEFLVNPTPSQHHHFQSTGPTLYAMALLGCFDYLNKVVIREDCSIDETWLNQHASSVVLSEQMTLDNQGGNVNPKNEWDEIIPASEEYITIDTAQDIQTWQQGWRDHFEADEFLSKETRAWDLANLKHYHGYRDEYRKVLRGRYYFMLGYMIYFFPMAGSSQELIKHCETTVLRQDPRLFPEQTISAQRAMRAYLKRMAETMDGSQNEAHETNKTMLPYPSVSYNVPIEDVVHSSTGSPNNRQEELDKTIPTVGETAAESANSLSTHTTIAQVPVVSSSMPRILPTHLGVDPEILISTAASQSNTPPAEITNETGTKLKKSKKNIFSRWWHARKLS